MAFKLRCVDIQIYHSLLITERTLWPDDTTFVDCNSLEADSQPQVRREAGVLILMNRNRIMNQIELWEPLQYLTNGIKFAKRNHVMEVSDLVGLWVIKIKKPMILCARGTSRSREPSTKRRSSSENLRTACLF